MTTTTEKTAVPATAKKPQDRKPKDDGTMTVTVRGVELTVDREAFDDFELLDDLNALENGSPQRLPSVLRRLVGDQWGKVMDGLRDKDTGRVSAEAGAGFVGELMEALNPNS